MSVEAGDKAFWETKNASFSAATPDCDLLHPQFTQRNPSSSLTETHFFGFSVPEENIHAITYLWHHPNLGVVSGGASVWQGIKSHPLASELFNWTSFAGEDMLANDLWDYRFDNGYHVQTLEPLKRHRLRYVDHARDNAFDVETEALMEPALLATGLHFEQAMRVRGELTLRGKTYQVDCTHVRDRSWGQGRSEMHAPMPPITWTTGVFGDTLMFGCLAHDHPDLNPDWKGRLEIPGGDPTKGGWVYRNGTLVPIVATRNRVQRDYATLAPVTADIVMTDATGHDYALHGEVVAANRLPAWLNVDTWICLARWEYHGQICYGELQQMQWHDYIRQFLGGR
ncbi:DUF7064 domain-containing protein [Mycobacterium branderi]|uniref:Uncharacterized protein n=1 Tax=Mycobacterium branderi TaxID=43348 RepID=A0A7I7WG02_9MYCO|nr:hypothetical protein [Mycobacterium branderi]MCV7234633.1 hypothetical protein [Mycobacterium branderi]ORA33169.1 hypothetical protein BST20_23255 [Mycobacterium branderi]BBZ15423.1 hypothetical protein MBRA_56180 [Mycobacterium branderi]